MKVDEVTKEDIDRISNMVKQRRLDNESTATTDYNDPYPCDEHRHFRCKDCHTVVCGREYTVNPWKHEGEHKRLCHTCDETIQTFEPHTPFWAESN